MSKVLGKSDILAASDLERELVEVPEWGGSVYVSSMSGLERDAFEASSIELREDAKGKTTAHPVLANMRAKLCARTIVDEAGERLFDDAEIEELGRKSAKALDRVYEVAQRLCGMREADIEELAGNLSADLTDTSPTS